MSGTVLFFIAGGQCLHERVEIPGVPGNKKIIPGFQRVRTKDVKMFNNLFSPHQGSGAAGSNKISISDRRCVYIIVFPFITRGKQFKKALPVAGMWTII